MRARKAALATGMAFLVITLSPPIGAQTWGPADIIAVQWSALVAANEACSYRPPTRVVARAKAAMQATWRDRWEAIDQIVTTGVWSQLNELTPAFKVSYCAYIYQRATDIDDGTMSVPKAIMPSEWFENLRKRRL